MLGHLHKHLAPPRRLGVHLKFVSHADTRTPHRKALLEKELGRQLVTALSTNSRFCSHLFVRFVLFSPPSKHGDEHFLSRWQGRPTMAPGKGGCACRRRVAMTRRQRAHSCPELVCARSTSRQACCQSVLEEPFGSSAAD